MVDIRGIENTPIYKTCFLRRNIIRLIQQEVAQANYTPDCKDIKALNGLLMLLNRELKLMAVVPLA